MSGTLTQSQRDQIVTLAQAAVFGVANARLRNDVDDAALVIGEYLRESIAICGDEMPAWSMLFSAAMIHFTDALEELAGVHGQSPEAELSDFALAFALDTV